MVLCCQCGIGHADDAAESLVRAFRSICYVNVPYLHRVEDSVKEFDSKEWPELYRRSGHEGGKAWQVFNGAAVPITVMTYNSVLNGTAVSVCSVVNPDAEVATTTEALNSSFGYKNELGTQTSGDFKYTYWYGNLQGRSVLIRLGVKTTGDDPAVGIILSAMANPNGNKLLGP
jgi:hypothetical protein